MLQYPATDESLSAATDDPPSLGTVSRRRRQASPEACPEGRGDMPGVDSLRAVERCKQHPGKMWVVRGGGEGRPKRLLPLLPLVPETQPWHSTPYQALPEIYVQNASLEIAWTRVVFGDRSIAGTVLMPFFTEGYEGFDINDEKDWWYAEHLLAMGAVELLGPGIVARVSGDGATPDHSDSELIRRTVS